MKSMDRHRARVQALLNTPVQGEEEIEGAPKAAPLFSPQPKSLSLFSPTTNAPTQPFVFATPAQPSVDPSLAAAPAPYAPGYDMEGNAVGTRFARTASGEYVPSTEPYSVPYTAPAAAPPPIQPVPVFTPPPRQAAPQPQPQYAPVQQPVPAGFGMPQSSNTWIYVILGVGMLAGIALIAKGAMMGRGK